MSDCSACGADLETPLGCNACGVVLDPGEEPGPFVVFGLEPTWEIDETDLKRRLRRIGRVVHPDFHAGVPEQRALAERNSACLNHAFEVLLDPFLRADWIVQRLGGPTEQDERQMPQAFLMEVLEWNEALDEADGAPEGSPAHAELERLAKVLHHEHETRLAALGARLTPLPAEGADELLVVRQELNAVRYLSRTLFRIRDLRFGTPKV
jgi:Fe-S protein assembly co-chaperone HscB